MHARCGAGKRGAARQGGSGLRRTWLGRWFGIACGVAGCAPMLAALVGGVAGAVGAQGMGAGAVGMVGPAGGVPGWAAVLGQLSWPLLVVSVVLLVASFWRTRPLPRAVAYLGVALLVVNQFGMTPWLLLPALALVLVAFLLAAAPRRAGAPTGGARG